MNRNTMDVQAGNTARESKWVARIPGVLNAQTLWKAKDGYFADTVLAQHFNTYVQAKFILNKLFMYFYSFPVIYTRMLSMPVEIHGTAWKNHWAMPTDFPVVFLSISRKLIRPSDSISSTAHSLSDFLLLLSSLNDCPTTAVIIYVYSCYCCHHLTIFIPLLSSFMYIPDTAVVT
jgi:hypothetical protein